MRNGYFQLICSKTGTSLKIMEPRDGGQYAYVRDIIDYLNQYGIRYNSAALNKGLLDARVEGDGYQFQINDDYLSEVKEGFLLNISPNKMIAMARFYPPSKGGGRLSAREFMEELELRKIVYGVKKTGDRAVLRKSGILHGHCCGPGAASQTGKGCQNRVLL